MQSCGRLGHQTLSAMRRAPAPKGTGYRDPPSATASPAELTSATGALASALAAFGPAVVDLQYLAEHEDAAVRRAAAALEARAFSLDEREVSDIRTH